METGRIANLRNALDFLNKCRQDVSYAASVGALNDAYEWVEEAARAVIQETETMRSKRNLSFPSVS